MVDNVSGILESAELCRAVTSRRWGDRLLGQNLIVDLPQGAVFVVNGNNIELGGDIPRRCYPIKLDPDTPRPWERPSSSFRIADLESFVRENRGELLAAILTILRGWFVAGQPNAPAAKGLGSFEAWRRVMAGVIHYVGLTGFLENLDDMYQAMDVEAPAWAAHFAAWHALLGEKAYTVQELIKAFEGDPDFKDTVPEPYLTELADRLGGHKNAFSRKYGWMLRKKDGVVFPNQLRLEKDPELSREQNTKWRVIATASAGSSKNEPAKNGHSQIQVLVHAGSFPPCYAGDQTGKFWRRAWVENEPA